MKFGALPLTLRHFLLLVLALVLTAVVEALPSLEIPSVWLPFVTAGITALLAWLTPLVQGYGLGTLEENK